MGFMKIKKSRIALRKLGLEEKYQEWLNQVGRKYMSLSDPIGDMLARIKNAQMRNSKSFYAFFKI